MTLPYQPRKRLGQHFLHDPRIIQRIIDAIHAKPEQHIVEIGPGLGALTRSLVAITGHLHAVEIDRHIIPHLQLLCRGLGHLEMYQADALEFDFTSLTGECQKLRVVGNLPYNISAPLLFHLLRQIRVIQDMHLMFQKEVVQRMAAKPGDSAYGRLSVMLQYYCHVEPLFTVSPGSFTPPPKVYSAFVRLSPHQQPPVLVKNEKHFSELVKRAFAQRRKMLRNSLRPWLDGKKGLGVLDLDLSQRPENLSLAEFAILSNGLQ